ncbi:MAG: hypothetical protein ACE5F7_08220 [Nitrospiria bacterium]
MMKNIALAVGLSLLGVGLFFVVDRLFDNKQTAVHFTEKITSSDFTEDLLKDAKSPGAKYFLDICTQCHITPDPKAHPPEAWPEIVTREIEKLKAAKKTRPELMIPNSKEIEEMTAFLSKKAARRE